MTAQSLLATESPVDAISCTLDGLTATAPDGRTAALDKCDWVQLAPCGCVAGLTLAMHGRDEVLTNEHTAMRSMRENAADAKEDERRGFRMVLILHEDYGQHVMPLMTGACPHDPQWGYVRPTRDIDGAVWERIGTTEWRHKAANGEAWRMEKWSGAWHVLPPRSAETQRAPYLGRKLDEALVKASAVVAAAVSS